MNAPIHWGIPLRRQGRAGCLGPPRGAVVPRPPERPARFPGKPSSIPGTVLAARGFLAAGVFCDIKRLGTGKGSDKGAKRDLALLVSEVPAVAAGLFTTNQVCAAPVKLCLEHLRGGVAQAIVANSGNANACTGRRGLRDAWAMAAEVGRLLHLPTEHVCVASTGRIGLSMPMPNVVRGIRAAVRELDCTPENAAQAAEAILTSDTHPKQAAAEFRLGGRTVRLGGMAKGAGMIQPGLSPTGRRPAAQPRHATMLCFLTTDASLAPGALRLALAEAVAQSFNRITVDGDMSTNDTVLMLANGLAGNPTLQTADFRSPRAPDGRPRGRRPGTRHAAIFQRALNQVCLDLARQIVRDGEGVSRCVTVRVQGARSAAEADAAARAVANSALVKTSWCGGDPNWGRILGAVGYSAAAVVEGKIDLGYSAPGSRRVLWSLRGGQPTRASFQELCAAVAAKEFDLHLHLHLGPGRAVVYTCDLTEAYVEFNQGDVGDPASLGG